MSDFTDMATFCIKSKHSDYLLIDLRTYTKLKDKSIVMLSLVSSKEPKNEHFPTYAYFWHYDILDSFRYYFGKSQ